MFFVIFELFCYYKFPVLYFIFTENSFQSEWNEGNKRCIYKHYVEDWNCTNAFWEVYIPVLLLPVDGYRIS